MGCATSKQPVCRNCKAPCSPMPRSYSMHVHHPPQSDGDTYHVVALTSTTLGSLNHIQRHIKEPISPVPEPVREIDKEKRSKEFSVGVIEAKTWSKMIEEKIPKVVPKTPTRTPPGEPETINAWELMEGLEDISPLRPNPNHVRSFSFHVSSTSIPSPKENGPAAVKPFWHDVADSDSISNSTTDSNATSILSEFDPDVISSFRKSLEELPPANPFYLKPIVNENEKEQAGDGKENDDTFDSDTKQNNSVAADEYKFPSRGKDKLILYFTSLRGVRKTYEDCCHVRVILKSVGVRVDERDVSMHSGFKDELKSLLPDAFSRGGLPRIFIGEKYIGGADEIRKMNEDGQLEKALEGCEMLDDGGCDGDSSGGGGGGGVCEGCGDIRFIPCETCSGSCKIYYEGDYDEEDEEYDEDECGFQRCPDCNENGLIRASPTVYTPKH